MQNNNKPVAIVLGGTVPHCELIKQLQERGYYVILVDYLSDSPGKYVADEHIQESTMDKDKVLQIAQDRNVSLVICGCVDQANITACYVMEQIGKKPPYSYDTALRITNKGDMKRTMFENGIPTSRYEYLDSCSIPKDLNLRYPIMVKPADNNSSNGVKKANNEEELIDYLDNALKISRNHKAIIEEYVEGQEISAYCFVKDRKAKLLMTAERMSLQDGDDKVIKCYSSVAPARISIEMEQEAERIATMIAQAYNLDNTALFFQGIVNGGRIDVIEFAPRSGGGSSFKTIKNNTGFDIISTIIDSWLGKEVNLESWHKPTYIYVVNSVYGKDGFYKKVTGDAELLKEGVIEDMLHIRAEGDKLDNSRASSSRVCFFLVKARDEKEMLEKIKTAYSRLDVLDVNGHSIIRRELSLSERWGKGSI